MVSTGGPLFFLRLEMKSGSAKHSGKLRKQKKSLPRIQILKNELRRIGKVGGVYDHRLGEYDKKTSEDEKLLRRHIVEKMRQLETISFNERDTDDPLVKAAFDKALSSKQFTSEDQAYGGIQSDIVDEEFFSGGPEASVSKRDFKDILSEKIALSKLQRLKHVEENEEQRERLKMANTEWSQNIRFLISNLPETKILEFNHQKKNNIHQKVTHLVEELSVGKRVAPIGFNAVCDDTVVQNKLAKLENVIMDTMPSDDADNEKKNIPINTTSGLFRILLRIPKLELSTIKYLANELEAAHFRGVKDVIHYLLLTQIAWEFCSSKIEQNSTNSLNSAKCNGNGSFCPELIHVLTRMFQLTLSNTDCTLPNGGRNVLCIHKPLADILPSVYLNLNLELADPVVKLSKDQLPLLRLACIDRMIKLAERIYDAYNHFLPKLVLINLFRPIKDILEKLNITNYPNELGEHIQNFVNTLKNMELTSSVLPALSDIRLTILSSENQASAKVLKKYGLVPQLEPSFKEKIDPRRPKTSNGKITLQRKIAREKRGAMREIRRDSHCLASCQLKTIKDSDKFRRLKTEAILKSIRTIED